MAVSPGEAWDPRILSGTVPPYVGGRVSIRSGVVCKIRPLVLWLFSEYVRAPPTPGRRVRATERVYLEPNKHVLWHGSAFRVRALYRVILESDKYTSFKYLQL